MAAARWEPRYPDQPRLHSRPDINVRKLTLQPGRRYLVRFNPKSVPHMFADVLVIGGGIAGIRAALEVDPSLQTIVVTKDVLDLSNSAWAQGGSISEPNSTPTRDTLL